MDPCAWPTLRRSRLPPRQDTQETRKMDVQALFTGNNVGKGAWALSNVRASSRC
jgi:hypothetical protein